MARVAAGQLVDIDSAEKKLSPATLGYAKSRTSTIR